MSKVINKENINDLSKFFLFDEQQNKYYVESNFDWDDINGSINYLLNENNLLDIPSIEELSSIKFPYIQSPSEKIVDEIILRNRNIKSIVINSVNNRNSKEIKFNKTESDNKKVLIYGKSIVQDLNRLIYKYKINHFLTDIFLVHNNYSESYFGKVDLIMKGMDGWYLFIFKFSKTPYNEKYLYEMELLKKLIEQNSDIVVKKGFILNPLTEISTKEINW